MADDSDLERSEPASQRRLEQAREEGQVPRSRELATFAVLLAASGMLYYTSLTLLPQFSALVAGGLRFDAGLAMEPTRMLAALHFQAVEMVWAMLPLLAVLLVISIASPLSLGGLIFSTKAFMPDFSRLSPLNGIKRIFSVNSLVELAKTLLKAIFIGGLAAWLIWDKRLEFLQLVKEPIKPGLIHLGQLVGQVFLWLSAATVLIALLDVPWQIWQYNERLKMTREQLKQEAKEAEGDPQLKARVRSLQRQAARQRMMSEVPRADVIVTNPTHFAVALRYEDGKMKAPQVIAKGRLKLAERILEVARESGVPVLQAPPLARALYFHAPLGKEIPVRLYQAVADVLAYIFRLQEAARTGLPLPPRPVIDTVPPDLDPETKH